ncbi:hypothetical protein LOK49_LG06G03389 [Camellia lanceoleosa]|uniref:Uncharacterized protein n=1 Tax=Camellia lanceoleosa TaxID=1840588 RepID=A0ACC0HDV0_9ERIC|nr:hypothetical protein LOK49_LG06G03389 [Camellia lanceoleosa]
MSQSHNRNAAITKSRVASKTELKMLSSSSSRKSCFIGTAAVLQCSENILGTWFWCCGYHIPTVIVKTSVFLFHELAAAVAIKMDWG